MSEKRTSQQQKALELWCKILAEDLNAAGLDQQGVKAVNSHSVESARREG